MTASGTPTGLRFLDGWDEHPDHPALITRGHTITYAELAARVEAESQLCGMDRGLVLIELKNTVAAIVSYLAALRSGHVVLVASDAGARDALVAAYDPDVVVGTDDGGSWRVNQRRAATRHDLHAELALLLSTSGSTGSPKLVRLSYANLDSNAEAIAQYLRIDDTDRAMTVLPLSYCYGLSVLHSHLAQGAAVVVTELSVVDSGFWNLARAAGATSFAGVPYTFELLDGVGFTDLELPSLRYITQAGGKMGAERVLRYAELGRRQGWDLIVMYGQTEATARMAYLPPERVFDAPEAIGQPIPGGAFTIDGDSELIYHGPNVMLGYAQTPDDLALGRTIDCLHTGDLARRREDGLYEIIGRRSRFLKLFGLRIDLDRLEQSLLADGIQALCAGDDTRLVIAVTRHAPDPSSAVCARAGLPAAAVETVVFDVLPRKANGKPDYASLMRCAEAQVESASAGAGKNDVRALYRDVLGVDEVTVTDTFVSLGGDSLSFVETSRRLDGLLGTLPAHWYLLSVAELEREARGGSRGLFAWMELSAVLRAAAIVLVCANHVGLTYLFGGAHVLLAVAGYSFARFQLNTVATSGRVRPLVRSIVRIAVPSVLVITVAYVVTGQYDVWNILLIEHLFAPEELGPDAWDPVWNYWFIEVLVLALVCCAVLLSIPAARRLERTWPFGFAAGLVVVGLVLRFQHLSGDGPMELYRPVATLWLFAIGWAAARATRDRERLLLTLAAVCGAMLPGFSDGDSGRKLVIACGLLLLIWVGRVPVPVGLRRVTAVLASASLLIYLTQPLTFFLIEWGQSLLQEGQDQPPASAPQPAPSGLTHDVRLLVATVIALVVGVLAWKAYELVLRYLARSGRNQLHAREHDGVVP
ncbi:AMP-binding protein [Mycolicibacterium goodii]|uniref:AMP-binding protein n=1 Tax=Mycolicibacterium goodii TaxID=134601 RepID=UPI000C25D7BF|nr:AMP-binding protein [Mycolicibacterium goodii]PJK21882.1 AMP-dependent synthetase [Mycolicibacterium goodii]